MHSWMLSHSMQRYIIACAVLWLKDRAAQDGASGPWRSCLSHTNELLQSIKSHSAVKDTKTHARKRLRRKNREDHARYLALPERHHAHFVFGQPAMKLSMHPGT